MQEKESVNFFYYSNPIQIKKISKRRGFKQYKNRQQMRDNKQNQANFLTKTF